MNVKIKRKSESYKKAPPKSFDELIESLNSICGKTFLELCDMCKVSLPISTVHGKGFAGELIELCLGASAGNASIPDFPNLGLELKTVPVDDNLEPLESMFISYAPLTNMRNLTFEQSSLFAKISRVLFVIIHAPRSESLESRKVLGYFFYSPTKDEMSLIARDFYELMELVKTGQIECITARFGTVIQMRPKCANGKALTDCIGPLGVFIKTRPRGFYMRRKFIKELLKKYWITN